MRTLCAAAHALARLRLAGQRLPIPRRVCPGEPDTPVDGDGWAGAFSKQLRVAAAALGRSQVPRVVPTRGVSTVGVVHDCLFYNPKWMSRAGNAICGGDRACLDELVLGIAAHETSHLLDADQAAGGSQPLDARAAELVADRRAGAVLAGEAASLSPLLRALGLGSSGATHSHPHPAVRRDAVLAGAARARRGDGHGFGRGGRGPAALDGLVAKTPFGSHR
ncbi:MAG: hypothetical protein OXU20_28590 [Myxococcales bacterium]|nr:hypothetical protein [Myxococcales bacterium]